MVSVSRLGSGILTHFMKDLCSTGCAGRCEFLDVNSPAGADQLTDQVTESVLENVGGDELVQAYRAKFTHGYK